MISSRIAISQAPYLYRIISKLNLEIRKNKAAR